MVLLNISVHPFFLGWCIGLKCLRKIYIDILRIQIFISPFSSWSLCRVHQQGMSWMGKYGRYISVIWSNMGRNAGTWKDLKWGHSVDNHYLQMYGLYGNTSLQCIGSWQNGIKMGAMKIFFASFFCLTNQSNIMQMWLLLKHPYNLTLRNVHCPQC